MSEDEPRIRVEIEQGNPLDQYLPPDAIVIKQDDGSIWIEAPGREGGMLIPSLRQVTYVHGEPLDTLFEDAQAGFVRQFGTPLPQPPDALNEKEQ
jgi:hypothetical protein